ncbi:MAG: serine/threonine protein kinase [Planctomyces sp.]|nr:serine/threonine protein kinase [Planctomyces sp.]
MSSSIRREQDPERSGTAYTFLKPMPSVQTGRQEPSLPLPGGGLAEAASALFAPRDASPSRPVTGIALGPYRIEEQIGRGGMGAVFRAIDDRLDRIVALKVLSPELSRDRSAVQRFQNEARAAARLDHDNIAQVHDVGHDQGLFYIAFEFVAGTNLRELLLRRQGAFSVEEALSYALQIADALRQTAAADVVHRDIKPSNIIISPEGRAKLVDWGLARQNSLEMSQELTQTGTTLGTFDYISPEQAVDPRNVDVRSDIYSLGCTLYHMLTGEPPYPRGSMFQKVVDHHRAEPPDAQDRNPQVPEELSRIVRRMMASDPALRYATAEAVVHDLTVVAIELGLQPASHGGWVTIRARDGRVRAGWGWLGAFVGLLAMVLYLDRTSRRPDELALKGRDSEISSGTSAKGDGAGTGGRPGDTASTAAASGAVAPDAPPADESSTGLARGLGTLRTDGSAVAPDLNASSGTRIAASRGVGDPLRTGPESTGIGRSTPPSGVLPPDASSTAGGNFRLVSSTGESQRFRRLESACAAAMSNDVIELDFDGPAVERIDSLKIQGKQITIRSAAGRRPLLTFGLPAATARSGSQRQPRLISLSGERAALELLDVDLLLDISSGSITDRWVLFSVVSGSQVDLRGVSVTVVNPDRAPAAVFEISQPASTEMMGSVSRGAGEPTDMALELSLIRGPADLISHMSPEPLRLDVRQSAFALNGVFYRQPAGRQFSSRLAASDHRNEMFLDFVTGVFEQGLVAVDLGDTGDSAPIHIDGSNSILWVSSPQKSLISMSGPGDLDRFINLFSWRGNSTYYDVQGPFWEVNYTGRQGISGQTTYDFAGWKNLWRVERQVKISSQPFQNPSAWNEADFTRVTPQDFRLRPSPSNPPVAGADDGRTDAGVDVALPRFPATLPRVDRPSPTTAAFDPAYPR